MLVSIDKMNQRILAKNAKKKQIYKCPYCQQPVILRQGEKVIPHFAHKANIKRSCYKAESFEHYQLKLLLAQKFVQYNYNVDIEPYYDSIAQYPDLVINHSNAIEIQCSRITIKEVLKRTIGLERVGLKVYWLVKDVKRRGDIIELTQFQTTFINPINRTLLTWDFNESNLIIYKQIQHIAGKKFISKRYTIPIKKFFNTYNHEQIQNYKLSKRTINNYIRQCRMKNSVLQPTLSAMYQLQVSDDKVNQHTGFIFPNQIYVETHPIEWQLVYLLLRCNYNIHQSCKLLLPKVKFRYFASHRYNRLVILKELLNDFEKKYNSRCLNVQN